MGEPITVPGVYEMPAAEYFADPVPDGSLSSSGARKLLPPSCPALYRYEQDNGQQHRDEFDFGHAAHGEVLGSGPELVVIEADDWRTKAAKEARAAAYADGAVPLLAADYDTVQQMAEALRAHPVASALFNPLSGRPEQTLVWQDDQTQVWRRARLDWLPHATSGRMILPDYKTTRDASPEAIQKSVHQYGYFGQAAWYLDGVHALGLAEDAAFVFVFQMKTAPFLVTVAELDVVALKIGRGLNRRALELYKTCVLTGRWPAFSDDVVLTPLPGWAEARLLEEIR